MTTDLGIPQKLKKKNNYLLIAISFTNLVVLVKWNDSPSMFHSYDNSPSCKDDDEMAQLGSVMVMVIACRC